MATNPNPSNLDQQQILQRAFDESQDKLRVDTSATIIAGAMEVSISHVDDDILIYGNDGTTDRKVKTDAAGELQIDVLSSALPTGAATEAKQDVGNTSLSSINSKTPPLGQALMAASSPVVIASDQSAISIKAQDGAGNLLTSQVNGTQRALDIGIDVAGVQIDPRQIRALTTGTDSVTVGSSVLPTGAATSANQVSELTKLDTLHTDLIVVEGKQDTGNTSLSSIDTKITTTINGIKVDGSAVTQPISAVSLPLPSGASTSANQTTTNSKLDVLHTDLVTVEAKQDIGNASLASVDGKLNSLGQKVMSGSVPVTIASDQSSININNISGTVSLPTGAATSANQTSELTKLDTLHTDLVVIEGKQDTGNTSLSSIDGKITTTTNGIKVDDTDINGATSMYVSTVGTTAINIPSVAGNAISTCLVRCATDNTPISKRLLYSFDGGTTFATLSPGEYIGWSLKGSLTQISIKGSAASVSYEVILNRIP